MTTVLITGISGQDGLYLAEFLLDKQYRIVGTTRNIKMAQAKLSPVLKGSINLVEWNMLDQKKITKIMAHYRPSECFNLAAFSSGSGMFSEPDKIGEINGMAVVRILEAIREVDPHIRFCQASSREIFGEALESPQSEKTLFNPRSPYGAAKQYADSMIRIYRQHYGLFACSAILFNHESPRRGLAFVTRKIVREAVRIKLGFSDKLYLGNLETGRDWGFAGDYVRAMWLMLQQASGDDYVVATGETHTVRQFCDCAFNHLGLNYTDYVCEDSTLYRSSESILLVGDARKARKFLAWKPEVSFQELIISMVESDLKKISGLKSLHGHHLNDGQEHMK